MTDQHPITPPPELVEQWMAEVWHEGTPVRVAASDIHIATQAAQWGANIELEACCEWLFKNYAVPSWKLRAARRPRPKPLSLKEQALKILEEEPEADEMKELVVFDVDQVAIIRKTLEQLDD